MKIVAMMTMAALLAISGAAMAQSNATQQGTASPNANGAGDKESSSNVGSVTTSTGQTGSSTGAPASR